MEWVFIDGSYAKAHQHSAGAASGNDEAIGKSRAGNTSKIHLAVDAHGLPIEFEITGGQINDCTQAPALIAKLPEAETIVADKGYDSERVREQIEQQGAKAVIPRRRNSVKGNADLDRGLYRNRHWVENAFARLKHYRAVASRFDKLKKLRKRRGHGLCLSLVTYVKLARPFGLRGKLRYASLRDLARERPLPASRASRGAIWRSNAVRVETATAPNRDIAFFIR